MGFVAQAARDDRVLFKSTAQGKGLVWADVQHQGTDFRWPTGIRAYALVRKVRMSGVGKCYLKIQQKSARIGVHAAGR